VEFLRVEIPGQLRRTLHVHKKDGDLFALAPKSAPLFKDAFGKMVRRIGSWGAWSSRGLR
jgi:hypothetical protein